jgi:predicted nucleic acid-binding protein
MTTYLVDTSILIDVLNGKRGRDAMLLRLLSEGHLLGCCGTIVTEVYAGMRPHERAKTDGLVDSLQYFPVTPAIAKHAGRLKYEWARKGVTLSTPDTTIAAVALNHTLVLLTDNRKHYPMPELRLFDDSPRA